MRPLGTTGVWSSRLRFGDAGEVASLAAELEELGYGALWIPDTGGDVFGAVGNLLSATRQATVATGILNVWMHRADDVAAGHARLVRDHGDRFLCGVGISHAPLVQRLRGPGVFERPLAVMSSYLDALDQAASPLPAEARVLAALGPKMLELARARSAGTHPYLVTPTLTHRARVGVGPDRVVACEVGVVLERDARRARDIARAHLQPYLGLPNYTNNWRRDGFDERDLADGGSDRLVDALVAWGDETAIAARIAEHRAAGADHVCIQVLTDDPSSFPVAEWRALAPAVA